MAPNVAGTHGKNAKLVGYGYDLTSYFRQVTSKGELKVADKSVLGDAAHSYDPGMQGGGSISANGLYSDSTGDIQRTAETLLGVADGALMHLPFGYAAAGSDFLGVYGTAVKYDVNIPHDDMVDIALEAQGQTGIDIGRMLNASILTSLVTATPGTAVDFGAATASGGSAWFVCTALTGTSATVTVEDSADGSTGWAAVATFAAQAAIGSQRVEIPFGAVRRYLRYNVTGTFTVCKGVIGGVKYAD